MASGEGFRGRVVIVTGAARGLGAAYCTAFGARGASVVAADLKSCADTVDRVTKAGGSAVGVEVDVADAASTRAMAEAALERFGRIDVLINNAAAYANLHMGRFDELGESEWDTCMTVNVKGPWLCSRAVVPAMRRQGGGSIINISSLAAAYGMARFVHYATSKAGVIGLTRSLARELGRDEIRVNSIAPSLVRTEGTTEAFQDKEERMADAIRQGQSLRRNLAPEDVVGTALYLASDDSRFVTGQTLMVDGGTVLL